MGTGKELQTPQDTSEDRLQLERGSKGNKDTLLSLGRGRKLSPNEAHQGSCLSLSAMGKTTGSLSRYQPLDTGTEILPEAGPGKQNSPNRLSSVQ